MPLERFIIQNRTLEAIKLPVEDYGKCKRCGEEGYLGDGLCRMCWDNQCDCMDRNNRSKGEN